MCLPPGFSRGRLTGTPTASSSARRAHTQVWPVCSQQATALIACTDRRSQRQGLAARGGSMRSAIWPGCTHDMAGATPALRLGGLNDLDKRNGVWRVQQALTKIVLPQQAREGSHHPQVIGHHLFRRTDQEDQLHGLAILGFKIKPLAAAATGDQDVGALRS